MGGLSHHWSSRRSPGRRLSAGLDPAFGVIATRLGAAPGDICARIGSGNIGATNVLRTDRRDLAAITLIGDGGKGAVAALVAYFLVSCASDRT